MRSRAIVCCLALSACSGGGSSAPAPRAQLPVETVKATVTVIVPSRTQSTGRNPRYVSVSTQSMTVSVSSQGSGGSASSTVNCYLQNPGGPNTCTTTVDAPVGPDMFTVNLYDGPNGTGNTLSSGSTTFTIVQGTLNLVSLTFVGVPAAIKMSFSPTGFARGLKKKTIQLTVTEVDADNNVIVGPPAAYPSPITLMNSDATGSVTLSTTQVTAASQPPITVSYNGSASAPSAVTITATAPGIPAAKIDSASIPILTGTFVYVTDSADLFGGGVVQFFAKDGLVQAGLGGGGAGYTNPYSAAVAPDGTIYSGRPVKAFDRDFTLLRTLPPDTNPHTLATDGGGNVYVSSATNISVYPPNATEATAPLRVMNVGNTAIAVDTLGEVISYTPSVVSVYPPKSSGNVTATRTITPASGITWSGGVSVDTANNIYLTGQLFTQNAILVYPPTAQGAASPSRIISGPTANVGTPYIAVDAAGYIWICCSQGMQSYSPTATGDVRWVGDASVPSTLHTSFTGIAVDPNAVTNAGPP